MVIIPSELEVWVFYFEFHDLTLKRAIPAHFGG